MDTCVCFRCPQHCELFYNPAGIQHIQINCRVSWYWPLTTWTKELRRFRQILQDQSVCLRANAWYQGDSRGSKEINTETKFNIVILQTEICAVDMCELAAKWFSSCLPTC